MRTALFALLASITLALPVQAAEKPNLLIISVDDMSADSLGAFGCKLADTSPHIDRLAAESLQFNYAHVQVGNCMPSRNVMWSGLYSHHNGVEGFYQVKDPDYPVLCDLMKEAGYFTAIRGKVSHSTPYSPYAWDLVLDTLPDGKPAHTKNVASYGTSTEQGIRAAAEAGKPFCLMINVSDPHKPFYAEGKGGKTVDDPNKPSREFSPDEVPVPGFLPDDPVVRKELSHYYMSVRRADDCVGRILEALDASGKADNTLVMFFSDHGMPLPFAKTQLYHHSTHTPLLMRWPGVTQAGAVDRQHMVSAVDFLPTLLDVVGAEHPSRLDGRSFLPLLKGEAQGDRKLVFKEYNENSGGFRNPMRGVQSRRFLYLFNPWANGTRKMATATNGTSTYRRMKELAATDPAIAARVDLADHRVVEEFYDIQSDPDALVNLIDDPVYQQELAQLREALDVWMVRTGDPLLEAFRQRSDAAALEAYMARVEKAAADRKANKRGKQQKGSRQPAARQRDRKAAG